MQAFTRSDKEVTEALRRAVVELQAESDDKNLIAKLHMQVRSPPCRISTLDARSM